MHVLPAPSSTTTSQRMRVVALVHQSARQAGDGLYTGDSLAAALRQRSLDGQVITLGTSDDAAEVAERAARDGAQVVVAVGGDGTIHAVAKGLWRATQAGVHAALGIVPAGTMNNVAAALGVSEDRDLAPDSIAHATRAGRFRPLDLGQIGDMIFVEETGFGLLSELMCLGESVKRSELAIPAAASQVVKAVANAQPAPLTLQLDGRRRRFRALHVVICNAPVIAMRMQVAPGARMDDGLLDIMVYERFRPLELLAYLMHRIGGRTMRDARVRHYRAKKIVVEPSPASGVASGLARWPIEVDGEPAGDCGPAGRWRRIEARVLPHALQLAARPALAQIEEGPWRTAGRALAARVASSSVALTQLRTAPPSTTPIAASAGALTDAVQDAVQPVIEPPRRAAQRTALVRTLYLTGAVFAIVTGVAASRADVLPGDLRVTRALQRTRSVHWDRFWRAVAWAGFPRPTFLVIATATVALWLTRFRLEALFLLLATGVNALNFALKRIVRRKRPVEPKVRVLRLIKEPSFPSGHVMFYVSSFGFLVAAALANLRPSALRRRIVAVGGSLIGLVGASRIYLGAHWPSDVVAGYLFGGLYLGGVLELYTRAKRRQARHAPPLHTGEGNAVE
jgi:YegS/Rv2252/BmrU family lipid kinase